MVGEGEGDAGERGHDGRETSDAVDLGTHPSRRTPCQTHPFQDTRVWIEVLHDGWSWLVGPKGAN